MENFTRHYYLMIVLFALNLISQSKEENPSDWIICSKAFERNVVSSVENCQNDEGSYVYQAGQCHHGQRGIPTKCNTNTGVSCDSYSSTSDQLFYCNSQDATAVTTQKCASLYNMYGCPPHK